MTNHFHFFKTPIKAAVAKMHLRVGHLISAERSEPLEELSSRVEEAPTVCTMGLTKKFHNKCFREK